MVLSRAAKERRAVNRHTYGLLKKVEGLVIKKEERLIEEFDLLLDSLGKHIPKAISEKAGLAIYETEKKILTRLAELEPDLKEDEAAISRMNDLIQSMEKLEESVIRIASEVVRNELLEKRKAITATEEEPLVA